MIHKSTSLTYELHSLVFGQSSESKGCRSSALQDSSQVHSRGLSEKITSRLGIVLSDGPNPGCHSNVSQKRLSAETKVPFMFGRSSPRICENRAMCEGESVTSETSDVNPQPSTLKPKSQTHNPKPETTNPQPAKIMFHHSTLNA